jgi:hypothetical protein
MPARLPPQPTCDMGPWQRRRIARVSGPGQDDPQGLVTTGRDHDRLPAAADPAWPCRAMSVLWG